MEEILMELQQKKDKDKEKEERRREVSTLGSIKNVKSPLFLKVKPGESK